MHFFSVNAQKTQNNKFKLRKSDKSSAEDNMQSMIKTSVKLQKNQSKTVGGVAHTR